MVAHEIAGIVVLAQAGRAQKKFRLKPAFGTD
ncbi:hypothetical protein LJU08_08315 [Corynebacterium pseudotuberculosis]|nr:hypothetical protein LJU08_08315 [Corynebacterium pseudotuberculosis]